MTITCYECGTRIKFDSSVLSHNGRSIPLEIDGSLHDCPNKQPLHENWGLPQRQYQKRQQLAVPPQQRQLFSTTTTPVQQHHNHEETEARIFSLETEVSYLHDVVRQLTKRLDPLTGGGSSVQ